MEVQQRTAAELYLDLLKKCLTRYLFGESYVPAVPPRGTLKHTAFEPVRRWLAGKDMEVIRHVPFDEQTRAEGRDWPARAESMAGLRRLENLQSCVTDVLRRGVPGDLIETGAWRGGVTIFMRAILEAYGDTGRRVWVADSFQGLPRPDPERWPAEAGDEHWTRGELAVPLEEVQANFARYGRSTSGSGSSPAGSPTPCRRPRSSGWPCCAWTATCTARPWRRWKPSIPSSRSAGT